MKIKKEKRFNSSQLQEKNEHITEKLSFFWVFFNCSNIFKIYIYHMAILSGIHSLQHI